jgi:hypothetical protein
MSITMPDLQITRAIMILALTLGLVPAAPVRAQSNPTEGVNALELRLQPDAPEKGVPQSFTVVLLNKSDHDIKLPIPAVDCEGAFTGVMGVSFRFTPLKPSGAGIGHGCANDTFVWPPILERAKKWKVLRPGDSLSIRETANQMFCECKAPGKYEFWAGYLPPSLTPEDKVTLRQASIDFPHHSLESVHMTYEKAR